MYAVGDWSLHGSNQSILDTLNQIIDLERAELTKTETEIQNKKGVAGTRAGSGATAAMHANTASAPADYLCPITKDLMVDPVIASDGHSYERSAIETWFAQATSSNATGSARQHRRRYLVLLSPKTGAPLKDQRLIPNHTLKGAISQWTQPQARNPAISPSLPCATSSGNGSVQGARTKRKAKSTPNVSKPAKKRASPRERAK